jgi:hypothetical protein
MLDNSFPQTPTPGYAGRKVTKAPEWHALVGVDNMLNGLATGLFLVTALAELAVPGVFTAVAYVAYPVALALLLADLTCLTLDLGDPLRFHHMLRMIKLHSPMSLGVWSLTVFAFFLTAAVALSLVPDGGPGLTWAWRLIAVVGMVPALCSATYKGVLFSTTAQPVWRDARWLGAYLTSSALLIGAAEAALLALLFGPEQASALLRAALGLLLGGMLITLALLLHNVHHELCRAYRPRQLVWRGVVVLGIGGAIPLIMLLVGDGSLLLATAALLILAGSLFVRLEIVKIPHAIS